MNNADAILKKADALRERSEAALKPLNEKLEEFLGQGTHVFLQTDGWCICFEYEKSSFNTTTDSVNFKELFKMNTDEAVNYLKDRAI